MVAALLITAVAGILIWLVFFKFKWIRFTFAWAFALSFFLFHLLQEKALASQSKVIQLRNARLANRINLHLALGGSFDAAPAASQ